MAIEWCRVGVGEYNAESPKQGSKRFNSISKKVHFAHLGILFIYGFRFREEDILNPRELCGIIVPKEYKTEW